MKLLNNYITEIVNNRNHRKISGKDHTGVDFNQTQEKYEKNKKSTNIKGEYHCFHCGNKDHWAEDCPNIEEEQRVHLHINVGAVKEIFNGKGDTTGVSFFRNNQKKKTTKKLYQQNYLDSCSTYNQITEE